MKTTVLRVLSAALTLLPIALPGVPFADQFEDGTGQWTATGTWGLTTARFASPTRSATDSPGAFYTNNTDTALTMAGSVSLAGTTQPALSFFHQYALESGYDFGRVEISLDGGATWLSTPLGRLHRLDHRDGPRATGPLALCRPS